VYFKGPGYDAIASVTPNHILALDGEQWKETHAVALKVCCAEVVMYCIY
jgi:hypothetical protein